MDIGVRATASAAVSPAASRLQAMSTDDIFKGYEALLGEIKASNHQHPDHDTTEWPPRT